MMDKMVKVDNLIKLASLPIESKLDNSKSSFLAKQPQKLGNLPFDVFRTALIVGEYHPI
jgi:hypothetical protein